MGLLLGKGHIAPKTKTGTSVISKSTRKSRIFVYDMSAVSERLRQAESSYKVPVDKAFCIMGHQHDSDSAGSYCIENAGVLIRGFLRERGRRSVATSP